ncbi:MAG: MurR/RpiR family transcriptional regulator [Angelakisella sp.]|nr:MurR/RpiR family transcriptional regulator [Angelakisella sp.]MCI9528579.1 MurR/RpiR family transcriptional regulator [Angelakisella sp.]
MILPLNAEILESLTKTERDVVHFINSNEHRLSQLSIVDIAYETFSSPATVSRAIRKCRINGFNELRYKLASGDLNKQVAGVNEILNKSLVETLRTVEQISMADVLRCIQLIREAGRVYVFARGLTHYIANEFCFKLQLMKVNAMMTDDPKIMVRIAQTITPEDLVVIFSLNGRTPELVEAAAAAHGNSCPIIACTCNAESEIGRRAAVHIVGYKHSHVSFQSYEVTTRLPLLIISRVIIDQLASGGGAD